MQKGSYIVYSIISATFLFQCTSQLSICTLYLRVILLAYLDSGDLDVASNLDSVNIIWLQAMRIGTEAVIVYENLETILLVDNLEVEPDPLL